jgi:Holliday junction DNA helicase RuvA
MIGKLKGIIESIGEDSLLLDVSGVCYQVYLSSRSLQQLTGAGEAVAIFIETHVREDHIHLYGFLSESEKRWFTLLCTVQGVGAKMALGIQSSFTPIDLVQAIHARDTKLLTRANGVGPKLAERLVTELKNKVDSIPTSDAPMPSHSGAPKTSQATPVGTASHPETQEAVSALENLGYVRAHAYQVIQEILGEQGEVDLSELIRLSLQKLSS